jgi:hypothetical protein
MYKRTIVLMRQHYKYLTKCVCLVQSGFHYQALLMTRPRLTKLVDKKMASIDDLGGGGGGNSKLKFICS